jgi:DNA-binding LytR/AlgR family response regulator
MLHIAICDDESTICAQIEDILLSLRDTLPVKIEIEVFYSGDDLYRFITSGACIDLLFLDIELNTLNGIEIGKKIREELNNEATQIIYISGKESYALELFEIRPLNFLIKPLQANKIEKSVRKAIEFFEKGNQFFEFKNGRNLIRIPVKNIQYFESNGRKIKVFTQNEVYEFYGKLSEIEQLLCGKDFFQIHKSYLVNYFHVAEYQYESIRLTNKEELAISQQNRKSVGNWLLQRRREEKA